MNSKQIFFLCICMLVSSIVGMEINSFDSSKSFICLNQNDFWPKCIYDPDYHVKHDNDDVLFPVASIDPLPIEILGDVRFFVTSAIKGSRSFKAGEAFKILNPMIKQLGIIRGISFTNYRLNIYVGFDEDKCISGRDNVYRALTVFTQGVKHIYDLKCSANFLEFNYGSKEVKRFEPRAEIERVIMRHFYSELITMLNDKNWSWKSPVFQQKVKEVLGRRAQDFDFESKKFNFTECYWTRKEG